MISRPAASAISMTAVNQSESCSGLELMSDSAARLFWRPLASMSARLAAPAAGTSAAVAPGARPAAGTGTRAGPRAMPVAALVRGLRGVGLERREQLGADRGDRNLVADVALDVGQ